MPVTRRELTAAAGLLITAGAAGAAERPAAGTMHGLIGRIKATPGRRGELAEILLHGVSGMPGCLSYVVAADPTDADALWITEVWVSREHHQRSLELPSVQDAVAKGRPLIAAFEQRTETVPLGGHGLAS